MGKNIEFSPELEVYELLEVYPKPATAFIPEWYKKMPQHSFPDIDDPIITKTGDANATAKMCVPVLDILTSGYIFSTPADVQVSNHPDQHRLSWSTTFSIVGMHPTGQIPGMPTLVGHEGVPYRWKGTYAIKTPPGYSVLVMHPVYRNDLPFTTLSAVVDTDRYSFSSISFPFFLKEGFEGIIPKGTPVAQIIPFKREGWGHTINKYNPNITNGVNILNSTITRSYKTRFWSKKKYQ